MSASWGRIGMVCALVALASNGACREQPEIVEEMLRPIRYQVVTLGGGEMRRTFSGQAQSGSASRLSFRVSGNIESIAVEVGEEVRVGEPIAQLDTNDYELQLQEAQAAASQASAEARNARANYERVQALYEANTVPRADLDAARAGRDSAAAATRSLRQRVQMAREQVDYCTLDAPTLGIIAAIEVEVNENVSAGQPVVLLTSGMDEALEVMVSIPETVIARVHQGDRVTVRFDAIADRSFDGVLTEVGVTPNQGATTFPITVLLEEWDPDVRPGMAADVIFTFESSDDPDAIWAPHQAIAEDRDGRYLFVATPSGDQRATVHRREAVIGLVDSRGIEVTDGLEPGDLLVTAGVHRIWDGLEVVLPDLPSGEAPAATSTEDQSGEAE